MGTPVVDGVLDEIYKQSVAVQLGEPFHTTGDSLDTDATATAYLLYDADNLYVCVVVNDDDILLREKSTSKAVTTLGKRACRNLGR